MQEITIVVGMPGSGKTTLIKKLKRTNCKKHIVFDDIFANWFDVLRMFKSIKNGRSIIVSDIQFCKKEVLKLFVDSLPRHVNITMFGFENDSKQCIRNVMRRKSAYKNFQIKLIKELTKRYKPNKDAIPVWKE